jgi:hypothetical protein
MRRLAFLAVLSLAVAGCIRDDVSTRPPVSVSSGSVGGTYTLRTVGGSPPPYTYAIQGADTYEVLSDAFVLTGSSTSGTFTETWQERRTIGGVVTTPTFTDNGTYTLNGTAIAFVGVSDPSFTGTLSGNTLTLTTQLASGQAVQEVYTR